MRPFRFLPTVFAAMVLSVAASEVASAATESVFSQAAFSAAQHEGKPILVNISATWCPTCAAQKPILAQIFNEPAFKDLVVYHVDFDSQKDVVRAMGAQMQSTLIAYNGNKETGRSTGDTNAGSIKALVSKVNQ